MEPRKALSHSEPQLVLHRAAERFDQNRIAISFSGAEDVVLIDMAHRLGLEFNVFSLDTGRLHPETYRYLETVRDHYQIQIELLMPEPDAVAQLVSDKGLFSFYKEGHGECCAIRKIEPLRRKLATLDAMPSAPAASKRACAARCAPPLLEPSALEYTPIMRRPI